MVKTIEDCQDFVNAYNKAYDEGKKKFDYDIELKDGRIVNRLFTIKQFKIKLNDEKKVNTLLKGENKFIDKEGAPFCPCKLQHIDENICPCKDCLDEAEEMGHCHCQMYVRA